MKDNILVTNIQRFSLHDGPGIRTTVFLKGCSLRCPWCSNPENLEIYIQDYVIDGKKGTYGKFFTTEKLIEECLKDKAFYNGKLGMNEWNIKNADSIDCLPGGVTFSGGECLLRVHELKSICERLHSMDVHVAVETNLFVPEDNVKEAIRSFDLFYVDVKILDEDECCRIQKGSLKLFLSNLDILMKAGKPIIIRVPVIGTYTDGDNNRRRVIVLVEKYRDSILKIELIKEHNLGRRKYLSLKMMLDYHGVDMADMERYRMELSRIGIPVDICTI